MKHYLLALLLAFISSNNIFLSPTIPPTAFIGQYYTLHFRTLKTAQPLFHFQQTPPGLTGYPDGRLQGTPTQPGTFSIFITLQHQSITQTKEITLRVRHSVASLDQITAMSIVELHNFHIELPSTPLAFLTGQSITLQLTARNGQPPYQWTYLHLPPTLQASLSGSITGVIQEVGYYCFSASVVDKAEKFADSYITLNIQPVSSTTASIVEVPNRMVSLSYDLKQVEGQQEQAQNIVYKSIKEVVQSKKSVSTLTKTLSKITLATQFAKAQEIKANRKAELGLRYRIWTESIVEQSYQLLSQTKKYMALVATTLKQAITTTSTAQKQLSIARKNFDLSNSTLLEAKQVLLLSQKGSSESERNLKNTLLLNLRDRSSYDSAFEVMSDSKKKLQSTLDTKGVADRVVLSAHSAVGVMNQANDVALGQLTKASRIYTTAFSVLSSANQLVAKTRKELLISENELSGAKFQMQQALNVLYVAQARKAQADKATSIVQAQTSTLPVNETLKIFAGCEQQAYPTISGSSQVKKANNLGYMLSSSNTLLFGECTEGIEVRCEPGEMIEYEGYLKEGYIHAIWYRRVRR